MPRTFTSRSGRRRRRRVLIIHTGGTFGLLPGGVRFARSFRTLIPEVESLAACRAVTPFRLDSSSMTPRHWQELARLVARHLDDADGFVITHGTDTMAYTAAALSFLLEGLRKPVVLTGAQRPFAEIRTDARSNILDAVEMATDGPPEVVICFGGLVLRGNRARKRSVTDYRAFESPNFPPLGEVGARVALYPERYFRSRRRFRLREAIDPRVVHIRLSPGLHGSSLAGLHLPEIRGIVLEAYGAGNLPLNDDSVITQVRRWRQRGIPVVIVSGSEHGNVDLSLYEGGRAARRAGAISGHDMTAETAIVKLMVALGRSKTLSGVHRILETNLAGERS